MDHRQAIIQREDLITCELKLVIIVRWVMEFLTWGEKLNLILEIK
jgi:hypothetical protein